MSKKIGEKEVYERIIEDSRLTQREKDLVEQIFCNIWNRGVWMDEKIQTIITTELIVLVHSHRKNVYDEVSDILLNMLMNMETLDANKIVDSIGKVKNT